MNYNLKIDDFKDFKAECEIASRFGNGNAKKLRVVTDVNSNTVEYHIYDHGIKTVAYELEKAIEFYNGI